MNFVAILKNKYYLSLSIFLVYMLFFNDADVFSVIRYHKEIHKLESEIEWYKTQTTLSQDRLNQLNQGGFALEKLAREKHYLQKEGEDVYIISDRNETENE